MELSTTYKSLAPQLLHYISEADGVLLFTFPYKICEQVLIHVIRNADCTFVMPLCSAIAGDGGKEANKAMLH